MVVVAATGLAVANILAGVGMALGSIGLAGADRVAAHSLVVVIAIDRAVLEVVAYISLQSSLYDFEGSKILEVRSLLVKTKSQNSSNPLYAYDGLYENIVMNHV